MQLQKFHHKINGWNLINPAWLLNFCIQFLLSLKLVCVDYAPVWYINLLSIVSNSNWIIYCLSLSSAVSCSAFIATLCKEILINFPLSDACRHRGESSKRINGRVDNFCNIAWFAIIFPFKERQQGNCCMQKKNNLYKRVTWRDLFAILFSDKFFK